MSTFGLNSQRTLQASFLCSALSLTAGISDAGSPNVNLRAEQPKDASSVLPLLSPVVDDGLFSKEAKCQMI
jgi:hypothetical protein